MSPTDHTREALTKVGRYSRSAYGPIADAAEAALIDVTDNGNSQPVTDDLRWTVLTVTRAAIAAHDAALVEGRDDEVEALRADVERFRPLWASPLAPPSRWVSEPIPYPRRYVSTFDVLKTYDESIRCSSTWPREKRHAAMDKALHSIPDLAYEIDHLRSDLAEARAALAVEREKIAMDLEDARDTLNLDPATRAGMTRAARIARSTTDGGDTDG